MSGAVPEPWPARAPGTCPLCASPTPPPLERCPSCGYALAGLDGRPSGFSRVTMAWTSIGFLAVYLVTLAIVAATR